jgi:SAM-dependent methyltransferase
MQILLGCGHNRSKQIAVKGSEDWDRLVTVDCNKDASPDILWDLNMIPLPLEDNCASEIHAYQVLEHLGQQGDASFFFRQWNDFWRILKPGGLFLASVPSADGRWAWADPGHRRVLSLESLAFIHRPTYRMGETAMCDYRSVCKCDFDLFHYRIQDDDFSFVLTAVKPARDFGDPVCQTPC